MSQQLISRSEDLKRLRDEGYDLEVRHGFLLVKDVPYVNSSREVKCGILVSELTTAGGRTAKPSTHVAMFVGEYPCTKVGKPLDQIRHSGEQNLAEDLTIQFSFSAKPPGGSYPDYYEKVVTYANMFTSYAQALEPGITARTYPVVTADEQESVFEYLDTASSRAGIGVATQKLEGGKIAIVGVGGTGSYVLDLVAKTPVAEIHLFDGDTFLSHNAFRAPGAATREELEQKRPKVDYFRDLYSGMRRGIVAHPYYVDTSNTGELREMNFVFLCIDGGDGKKAIVESLEEFGTDFIDVGIGMELVDGALRGSLRVTASLDDHREYFRNRVSLADAGVNEEYDTNIQVADLNALNAAMAVLKWKKLSGFYVDLSRELNTTFNVDDNALISDDRV